MEQVVHNTVIGMDVHQSKMVCCAMWQAGRELKTENSDICLSVHNDAVSRSLAAGRSEIEVSRRHFS